MASLNKVILMGNLTHDPDVRFAKGGTAVCRLNMAVNTKFSSASEEVLFIEVTVFGKTAEACGEYLAKGRPLLVDGRLRLERWKDEAGQNRQTYKVVANNVQFLGDGTGSRAEKPRQGTKQEEPELDFEDLPF